MVELASPEPYALVGGPFGSELVRSDYRPAGVPVIRGVNLASRIGFTFDDLVFVSEDKAKALRTHTARPGDLVFTQRGTLGQVGLIPSTSPYDVFVISQSQMKLTVDQSIADPAFIYYYFRLADTVRRISDLASSSGVPHINLETFRQFEVCLPPIETQRDVAATLRGYDALIVNSSRRAEALEELSSVLYRDLFSRERPRDQRADGDTDQIDPSWPQVRLGDVITLDKGVSYNGAGLTSHGTPMINLKNIGVMGFRRDGTKPYSGEFKARHAVKPEDIVLANTDLTQSGTIIGSPVRVPKFGLGDAIVSHHLYAVRIAEPDDWPREFVYQLLRTDAFKAHARGYSSGTTVLGLSRESVASFTFASPPTEARRGFSAIATPMIELAENLRRHVELLTAARDLVAPRLLSGSTEIDSLSTGSVEGLHELG